MNTGITATSVPSHAGRFSEEWGLTCSWVNRLIRRTLVFHSRYLPKSLVGDRGLCTATGTGTVTTDDGGSIPVGYRDYVDTFQKDIAETLALHRPINHSPNLEPGSIVP